MFCSLVSVFFDVHVHLIATSQIPCILCIRPTRCEIHWKKQKQLFSCKFQDDQVHSNENICAILRFLSTVLENSLTALSKSLLEGHKGRSAHWLLVPFEGFQLAPQFRDLVIQAPDLSGCPPNMEILQRPANRTNRCKKSKSRCYPQQLESFCVFTISDYTMWSCHKD